MHVSHLCHATKQAIFLIDYDFSLQITKSIKKVTPLDKSLTL